MSKSQDFAVFILLFSYASLIHGKLVILNWENHPQQLMSFSGLIPTNEEYTIRTDNTTKYKVSVALERMNARTCDSNLERPVVVINQGLEFESICFPQENYKLFCEKVPASYDFDRTVIVHSAGSWGPADEAQLVATIFLEVPSCSYCPEGAFCCQGEASCYGAQSEKSKTHFEGNTFLDETYSPSFSLNSGLPRCIPKSLECNGHPNCGKVCNFDESHVVCSADQICTGTSTAIVTLAILISRMFY
ncbi:unnamed protein product [Allacma fusca]|uniref:Uncharacterized protein n=1 Tax=Allacma fusca TaxID=39272 RepID=A0A8J2K043_9HEXA|nr:unnamed protein product [Allacma fusca]